MRGRDLTKMSAKRTESGTFLLRLEKLRRGIMENRLNGIILAPGPNLRYYTGVNSLLLERPFLFFVTRNGDAHLLAPTLESGPYLKAPFKITVHHWDDTEGPSRAFDKIVHELPVNGKWGLEGRVPFRFIHHLMNHAHPELDDAETILQGIRELKEPEEVELLKRAASILSKSFLKVPDIIRPGISELELARKISGRIYSNGAESVGDVLVQSGRMAADPHHLPSSKKLRRKESIVIDAACTVSGYFADITRTFIMGSDRTFESLYENILEAQEAAVKASAIGVSVGSVDQAARGYLQRSGLDRYFIHRTGHGLGLEVHEAPYIVSGGNETLQAGMIFTVEPGLYIPGKIGVRIEDEVLTTDQACKVVTKALPKNFGWWR
jgi:Xaa-Pro dipeptidase